MKKLKCDFCIDVEIEGENFDSWMEAAHAHYGSKHSDKIGNATDEEKAKWSANAKAQFEAAQEA